MIIIQLFGGIGNQLYQIGLGRAFQARGAEVLFHKEPNQKHEWISATDDWGIKVDIASDNQIYSLRGRTKLHRGVSKLLGRSNIVREKQRNVYSSDLLSLSSGYLIGYWQNQKYFEDITSSLKSEFHNAIVAKVQSQKKYDFVFHVRRTDYLSMPHLGVLDPKYYRKCFDLLQLREGDMSVLCVSDDIEWCRVEFSDFGCIEYSTSESPIEDFCYMMQARNLIIANSSFSWWAAYLNENAENIYCPMRWFNAQEEWQNWNCSNWLEVSF